MQEGTLGLPSVDDEYGPGRGTRWSQPWSQRVVTVLTVAGGLAVGFLATAGIIAGRGEAVVQDERRQALIEVIEERQARVDAQTDQLDGLRRQVADEASGSAASGVQGVVARAEELAGLRALRGPGVRVELADASGPCRGSQPQDCRIQDTDLQLVVNGLFAGGAEGVAVNGERVIATTAIRSAGGAVLVNYRVLTGPFTVEAVGDAQAVAEAFTRSDVAADFAVWTDVYGLSFTVEALAEVELPAYGGGLRLRHARAVAEETTGGTTR